MAPLDPRTPQGVAHIARLSRLRLDDAELAPLGEHMRGMLDWVEVLSELDTAHVSPDLQGAARTTAREDTPQPSLPVEEALANAPDRDDGWFLVPAVLSE